MLGKLNSAVFGLLPQLDAWDPAIMPLRLNTHTHTHSQTHTHKLTHTRAHTHTQTHTHDYAHVSKHTQTHIITHVSKHTHTHTHTHTQRVVPAPKSLQTVLLSYLPNLNPPVPHLNARYLILYPSHWHLLEIRHSGGLRGPGAYFAATLAGKGCNPEFTPINLCLGCKHYK